MRKVGEELTSHTTLVPLHAPGAFSSAPHVWAEEGRCAEVFEVGMPSFFQQAATCTPNYLAPCMHRARSIGILSAMCATLSVAAQRCVQVVGAADLVPVRDCRVLDMDGTLLAVTASDGLFCLFGPWPDGLILEANGYHVESVAHPPKDGDVLLMRPLQVRLPEVTVKPERRDTLRTPASPVATLAVDSMLLSGFERSGLRSALLWVPGVQMDQRGLGGSMRLSIRGGLVRSPFGVRGVKAYWGPFPITLADGSTPLELLDPELVGSLQVVRGLATPDRGSAPSGLLLAEAPWAAPGGHLLEAGISGGSNGFHRLALRGGMSGEQASWTAGGVHQRNAGYRDQEWTRRDQVFAATRWGDERLSVTSFLTWQDVAWGLPGSLDSLTAAERPTSARPFSQAIDARLEKRQLMAGIALDQRLTDGIHIHTALHGQSIGKTNPYGTTPAFSGYKEERIAAVGARMLLSAMKRIGDLHLESSIGVEALGQRDELDERVYLDMQPDTFRTWADTRVSNLNTFAMARLLYRNGTAVTMGIGTERTGFRHGDLLRDTTLRLTLPEALWPTLALSQRLAGRWWLTLRHGGSVSRPTVWEMLGTQGLWQQDLSPEEVREWEVTVEERSVQGPPRLQVSFYRRETQGLILPFETADGLGLVYRNAGRAMQQGIEAWGMTQLLERSNGVLFALGTLTLQHHRLHPEDGGRSFRLPGVPDVMAGAMFRAVWSGKGLLEAGARHTGAMPVGPRGGESLPAFTVLHLRMEAVVRSGRHGGLRAFVHLDNLGDVRYSAFVQMTDPGARYHNPAPGRSIFGGLVFSMAGGKN